MTEQEHSPPAGADLIELVFEQLTVALLVRAPQGQRLAATADEAIAALRRGPLAAVPAQKINSIVAARSGEAVPIGKVPVPAGVTDWFVVVSADGLAAYLVPVPGSTGDADADDAATSEGVTSAEVTERLAESGVVHGILEDVVASFDPPRKLEAIECVARGTPPVEGRDAHIEVGLNDAHYAPVVLADGTVDHHATLAARFVEEGAVIAMRTPPVQGTAGTDVTGRPLPARAVVDRVLDGLVGQNTELQGDLLVATHAGRPVRSGERIEVLPNFEVPGDLNYAVGNIEFAGDVIVRGDVKAGFSIVATGSVVVRGMLEHATIRAGRDISLQGAVGTHDHDKHGPGEAAPGEAALEAGGDIDALYLHSITVHAGGEVRVKREIVNCSVRADRVVMGSRGRIVGGEVIAETEIAAGSIGSHQGTRTLLHITKHRSDDALVVRASDAAHAGVRLNVSSAILDLEDDLKASSFWQLDGKVVRLDPLATLPDVIAFAESTGRHPPLPAADHDEDEDRPAA